MTVVLPDTSVWIRILRDGAGEQILRRALRGQRILLASVVAQELYAGTAGRDDRRDLDRIRSALVSAGLTVVPSFEDWCTAGIWLARYARLRGRIDSRAHRNDTLIVLCAAQSRATLLTWNVRDMARWARFLPRDRRVTVRQPGRR